MLRLSLPKNLQVSKMYIIFGSILRLLKKVPTVPQYWATLTGTGYKDEESRPPELLTCIQEVKKSDIAIYRILKKSRDWYNDKTSDKYLLNV